LGVTSAGLERRRGYLGASDIGAIMGQDEYRSAADVYLEKVTGVEQDTNEAANLGNHLEIACKTLAAESLGEKVVSSNPFRVVDGTRIGVNLDSWFERVGKIIPVECKTAGMLNTFGVGEEWGEAWTDSVPFKFLLQLHGQMMATKSTEGYISALLAGRGHIMYHIKYDAELAAMIRDAAVGFWKCVDAKVQPEGSYPTLDTLKRLKRVPATTCKIDRKASEQIVSWRVAVRALKDAEDLADAEKARVIDMLGDTEGAAIDYNPKHIEALAEALAVDQDKACEKTALTYLLQSRRGIDKDKLRVNYPGAFEACSTVSEHRVLRLGKPKKEKKGAKP